MIFWWYTWQIWPSVNETVVRRTCGEIQQQFPVSLVARCFTQHIMSIFYHRYTTKTDTTMDRFVQNLKPGQHCNLAIPNHHYLKQRELLPETFIGSSVLFPIDFIRGLIRNLLQLLGQQTLCVYKMATTVFNVCLMEFYICEQFTCQVTSKWYIEQLVASYSPLNSFVLYKNYQEEQSRDLFV